MQSHAAITVLLPPDEARRLWGDPRYRPEYIDEADASVSFKKAPGDRGTEIHVDVSQAGGKLAQALKKVTGQEPVAKVKDDLRRFKQLVETGVIAQSEATPGGESLESKLDQQPAVHA